MRQIDSIRNCQNTSYSTYFLKANSKEFAGRLAIEIKRKGLGWRKEFQAEVTECRRNYMPKWVMHDSKILAMQLQDGISISTREKIDIVNAEETRL